MRAVSVTAKIFISLSFVSVILLVLMSKYTQYFPIQKYTNKTVVQNETKVYNKSDLKYILRYTSPYNIPFVNMGVGRDGFIRRNCPYTNCVVIDNGTYLGDIKKFDVIAFAGPEVVTKPNDFLPEVRAPHQKYVFASIESPTYYPICSKRLDGFFNWSWTFRLDSIVRWGYMDIRDQQNKIIGPNKIMHWMRVEDMGPISKVMKAKLMNKTKAAAWFVSNCNDASGRLILAEDLKVELDKNYGLKLDIFGRCGPKVCPREIHDKCMRMVDTLYYFYLSFENSFSEDYVTEKLLQALKVDVVPIVYGGANYTR